MQKEVTMQNNEALEHEVRLLHARTPIRSVKGLQKTCPICLVQISIHNEALEQLNDIDDKTQLWRDQVRHCWMLHLFDGHAVAVKCCHNLMQTGIRAVFHMCKLLELAASHDCLRLPGNTMKLHTHCFSL